jgi:peptidoglycan/LPS O-acetylase OafA/YrhL
MLQDFADGKPGVWVSTLGGNHPLWSLSYEWWFYMRFFPLWRFVPERGRVHVAGGISLLGFATYHAWPNQASLFALYFIVWWAGAELARTYLRGERPGFVSQRGSLIYMGAVAGLAVAVAALARARGEASLFGVHPMLEARHLTAAFTLLAGGLIWARLGWRGFTPLFRGFAWAAPFSYALYVFHLPLAVESRFADGVEPEFLRLACYVAAAFGAAWLADVPMQSAVNRWTASRATTARPS